MVTGRTGRERYDVAIVGAGLAGLAAALELRRAGRRVIVLEARSEVGGRVRSTTLDGVAADLGGEWVGRAHRRIGALARELGLRLEPARMLGRPILWRLPAGRSLGRLPSPSVSRDLARMLLAGTRLSRGIDPTAPWSAPAAGALDRRSVAEWLDSLAIGADCRYVLDRVGNALTSTELDRFSLLHFLWLMRMAGGPLRTLHTTFQWRFAAGAQQLPLRMVEQVGELRLDSPVARIEQTDRVAVITDGGRRVEAERAIVAVPASYAGRISYEPAVPAVAEHASLRVGPGTKIVALLPEGAEPAQSAVIGGEPLGVAWRHRRRVTGFAVPADGEPATERLRADLADAFDVAPAELDEVTVCRWSEERHIPGCDLAFRPGEVCRHGPTLARPHGRLSFAGVERSAWPDNMEGAVESGQRAAAETLSAL